MSSFVHSIAVVTPAEFGAALRRIRPAARRLLRDPVRVRELLAMTLLTATAVGVAAFLVLSVVLAATPLDTRSSARDGRASTGDSARAAGPRFGAVASLGSELAVHVSAPAPYSPTPHAVGLGPGSPVVSTVTVTNVGTAVTDPRVAVSGLGTPSSRVFDDAGGIRLNSVAVLAPGSSLTYRVAFSIRDVHRFELSVTAGSHGVVFRR